MIRASIVMIVLAVALGGSVATAAPEASVISVNFKAGSPFLDVTVAIPKGIDNAARNGNADFGLRVTVTYVSSNQTVQTLDSGRLSIKQTTLLRAIDNHTDLIDVQLPFGSKPPPGNSPSYSATVELLHP
jgi:hypothetical protein